MPEVTAAITESQAEKPASSKGLFLLMLVYIFIIEEVVMGVLPSWVNRSDVLLAGVTDALMLIVFSAPLLWYIIKPGSGGNCITPKEMVLLLVELLLPIFVVELLVMVLLPLVIPADSAAASIVDAFVTTLFCAPLIWWVLFRRIPDRRRAIVEILFAPMKLYVLLLVTIFSSDLLEKIIFPFVIVDAVSLPHKLVDGFLSTITAAPIIWWLVIRPLRDAAKAEKVQAEAIRDHVVDAIVTLDEQGMIVSFNRAAEHIFRYRGTELAGQPVSLLLTDDAPPVEELLRKGTAAEGGEPVFELDGRRSDGATLTMDVSVSEVVLAGRRQFIAIMRDITARTRAEAALRESEQRFRQIFEQTEDAIILFKPGTCTIIDVNPTTEALFGFSKSELLEKGLEEFCSGDEYVQVFETVCGISSGGKLQLENIVGTRRDGSSVVASMRGKVITIQGVDITYCTFRDVTDRVRLEEEARNIQAKLIQANKMTSLGLLVSGVAHEINNPNTFIMANSQLLGRMWDDALKILKHYQQENGDFLIGGLPFSEMEEQSPEMFAGIVEGTRRIGDIVNNLKNFARADRRQADRPVNVNQAVNSALTMVYHQVKKHTSNFQLDLDETIPLVTGSNKQLEQVFINLIMNACQALPSKECRIELATRYDADADCVIVAVKDEGEGMSRQTISRIMEPFFTTKLGSGGTGLGLSICQSIIKEHRGIIECQSEVGKGSLFTIKIPAVRSECT